MSITLRKAHEADFTQLVEMVKQLAVDLGKPDGVKTTVNDYINAQHTFECLLAQTDSGELAGYVLYWDTFHTWSGKSIYIEDLFVKPQYRKQGVAQLLMNEVITIAKTNNCKNVTWHVLDWNANAISLYKKLGATVGDNKLNCHLAIN